MNEMLAVSWEQHRRTRSICRELRVPLHEMATDRTGFARYMKASAETLRLIGGRRPYVLFAQNPSIVLACLAAFYKVARPSSRVVVDAHNAAVEQLDSSVPLLRFVARAVVRQVDLTIVTNEVLAARVSACGGRPLVLMDPLPMAPPRKSQPQGDKLPAVAVIATYADDEPVDEIVAAASKFVGKALFYFTGRSQTWIRNNAVSVPSNVSFTGFLSDSDYWDLLHRSRVIVDLTTRRDCLVCGAYEAVAVGNPVVLTDSPVNRQTFGNAAIYSGVNAPEIESAIIEALAVADDVVARAEQSRARLRDVWSIQANALRRALGFSQANGALD